MKEDGKLISACPYTGVPNTKKHREECISCKYDYNGYSIKLYIIGYLALIIIIFLLII